MQNKVKYVIIEYNINLFNHILMKKLNKIIIISSILSCFSFSLTFADNSDCWIFGAYSYNQEWASENWFQIVKDSRETKSNRFTDFLEIWEQTRIISNNDLNTALLNLKKYCCENNLWDLSVETCKKDKKFFNDNAPDSQYLFDHLFDVLMRRLNWLGGEKNIYTKTKMTLDDKWTKRRKTIEEHAKNIDWSNPQTIINEYQKERQQSPSNLGYNITQKIYTTFKLSNQDFLRYVSWKWSSSESDSNINDSVIVANALKKYNERTLYDRYINTCALAEYFYAVLDNWGNSKDKNAVIHKNSTKTSTWACDKIVQRQIKWENDYVSLVIQRSSNLFLSNYVEWYMKYLYERQRKLQKLRKDSSDRWFDVTNAVPCLQHICAQW